MNKQGENGIPYCDYTWNPVTGCLHGCSYCFAERIAKRFNGSKAFPDGFAPTFHEKRLEEPERIKKPSRIFVSDMGDLFGDWVPNDWIMKVFDTIDECPQHTFLLLTKNPKRYNEFEIPKNAWIGTSVENQKSADERIPLLLQASAAVRFISAEPLLGSIKLTSLHPNENVVIDALKGMVYWLGGGSEHSKIDWVIVGGESGPGARPVHPDWVRGLRDQCQAAGTKFFFKQWGEWNQSGQCGNTQDDAEYYHKDKVERINHNGGMGYHGAGAIYMQRVGKKLAGRELDGRTWDELPEVHP